MDEIKPCPFCGDNDPYWDQMQIDNDTVNFLVCRDCGCEGPHSPLFEIAAKLWNIRTV